MPDEMHKRPVARQLLYSLEKYVKSDAFMPQDNVDIEMIDQIFKRK
jgi:hypothetical protein